MIAVIDNYDSFTFNLVQYLGELGADTSVYRNDTHSVEDIAAANPEALLVSPGPATPDKAGISLAAIGHFQGRIPILGVCLGHQSIGQYFGGKITGAAEIMHGKLSPIRHNGKGVFRDLPVPFTATRYHSLVVDAATLPDCLEVTAWVDAGNDQAGTDTLSRQIMGFRHKTLPVEGVQFHPESISSEYGHELLQNFLDDVRAVV